MRPPKGTSLAGTASIDVQYVGLERSGSATRLLEESPEKKLPEPYISPIWGAVTPRPIIMNCGLLGGPADVISCSNFFVDRLRGFCSARC
jgi:hypothetical protein